MKYSRPRLVKLTFNPVAIAYGQCTNGMGDSWNCYNGGQAGSLCNHGAGASSPSGCYYGNYDR